MLLARLSQALYLDSFIIFPHSYGAIKAQLANRHADDQPLTTGENFAAALGSGIITTVAANPLYVVRTRLVMERSRGTTAGAVLSQVLRKEGVWGLYKGLGASVLGVSHGAVQLLLYEHIKKNIAGNRDPVSFHQSLESITYHSL